MEIRTVETASDLKKFTGFVYSHYRDDKIWVPPLRSELDAQFDRRKNPTLDHCEYQLFLLYDGNTIIGRIAAFIDTIALEAWKEPIGLFGYFECIDRPDASKLLFDKAAEWLKNKGMRYMRGPWSFVSQEWGLVVEGYEPSQVIMAPYNPNYYVSHITGYGMTKIKDLLVYFISAEEGYQIPQRILTLTDDVVKRYGISVRQVKMKDYKSEVAKVIELSNKSLIDNWGYTSVTDAEAEAVARDLKPILHSKGVVFAEDKSGRPVGFAIAIPDVNIIFKKIKGKMLPFGWLKLITGIPGLKTYRLFALGVLPEYHGKGIDSLLYRALYESLYCPEVKIEINYVLEDNYPMNNAINKLNARPLRRYRIYQTEIA